MDLPLPRARLLVDRVPAPGETADVTGPEAAHARARRLAEGDRVALFDGSGREATARVLRCGRSTLSARVEEVRIREPEEGLALLVAAVRLERLSWIAEKATELGVSRIGIVVGERSQAFRATAPAIERLERIVREAAKQCGRAVWPRVEGPLSLAAALSDSRAGNRLFLDPAGDAFPASISGSATALLVGPEGGWSDAERDAAREGGWSSIALPAGRLRTETAALAGIVLTRAALSRRAV